MNCPQCGREIALLQGQKFCSFCGATLAPENSNVSLDRMVTESETDRTTETPAPTPILGSEAGYVPWEDQQNLGFLEEIGRAHV